MVLNKSPKSHVTGKANRKAKMLAKTESNKKSSVPAESSFTLPPLVTNHRKPVSTVVPEPPYSDESNTCELDAGLNPSQCYYDEWSRETTTMTTTTTKQVRRRGVFFTTAEEEEERESETKEGEKEDERKPQLPKTFWRYKPTGKPGLDRFRRAVDLVLITKQLFSPRRSTISKKDGTLFFLDIPTQDTSKPSAIMSFDPTQFHNIKEQVTVSMVREVLETPVNERSTQAINKMLSVLQTYATFSEYPEQIQTGICRKAWFTRFESRRLVCREGQRAEVFYFILSGVAVSRGSSSSEGGCDSDVGKQKPTFMRKGDVLGEREILENQPRSTSVITQQPLEVLALDKEDFQDVFQSLMRGSEESLAFLRSLDVLTGFPLENLTRNTCASSVHKYNRGAVIASNSNETEWVYAVKKGSCVVLKEVKGGQKHIQKRCSQRLSDQIDGINQTPPSPTSFLPRLATSTNLVARPAREAGSQKAVKQDRSGSERSLSPLHLPKITEGDENRLITTTPQSSRRSSTDSSKLDQDVASSPHKENASHQNNKGTAFVKLGILKPGDVFGLQSLMYKDSPSFVLVSKGAECVLLSKKFISDNMDDSLQAVLQTKVPPYPSMTRIQSAVQDSVEWELYKKQLYNQSLK